MADLVVLKKRRSCLKTRVTQFKNFVDKLLQSLETPEDILPQVELNELVNRIGRFESLYADFDAIQISIEDLVDEESLEAQFVERQNFEDSYEKQLAVARELAQKHEAKNNSSVDGNDVSSVHSSVRSAAQSEHQPTFGGRMKQIDVPEFSGEQDMWLEFRDTFLEIVHDNPNISTIIKFHYLRAALKGEAAGVIKALAFSAQSYD